MLQQYNLCRKFTDMRLGTRWPKPEPVGNLEADAAALEEWEEHYSPRSGRKRSSKFASTLAQFKKELETEGIPIHSHEEIIEALNQRPGGSIVGQLFEYPTEFLNADLLSGALKPSATDAENYIPAKTFT